MNDPLYTTWRLWQRRLDAIQLLCIAFVFVMIFILENVSRQTAHWLVWWLASVEMVFIIWCYLVQRKANKAQKTLFAVERKKLEDLYDRLK